MPARTPFLRCHFRLSRAVRDARARFPFGAWSLSLVVVVMLILGAGSARAVAADDVSGDHPGSPAHAWSRDHVGSQERARPERVWVWPVDGIRSVREPFRAPAHEYGPGHRGIDIAAAGVVRSPDDGTIAFAGTVVDRPLLTIEHADGLVTTLEPVTATFPAGTVVQRGEAVGTLATGGHAAPGTLHVGVRRNGEYINPLPLFGRVPRAILLPCGSEGC